MREARDGAQTGEGTVNWVRRMPSEAIRSRLGVLMVGLPKDDRSPKPRSSATMRITFRGPAGVGAGVGSTGAGVGVVGDDPCPPQPARSTARTQADVHGVRAEVASIERLYHLAGEGGSRAWDTS